MTLDDDTRALVDSAFRLPGDLATTAGAGERIRSRGGRAIRRRRLALASVSAGVAAAVAVVVLAAGAGGSHSSTPPAAPPTTAPVPTTAVVQHLSVESVRSSHPQSCAPDERQSLDLSACYSVDRRMAITGGFRATLILQKMPPASEVDAAIPPATIVIDVSAAQQPALSVFGQRGGRFVFSVQGRAIAERTGAQLNASQFRFTGAPDVMEQAWYMLLGRRWPPPPATLPPNSASPEDVVRAYIGALNRHDAATVVALRAKGANGLEPWYVENIVSITHLKVDPAYVSGAENAQTATVGVQFYLRQIQVDAQQNGETAWGYTLVRKGDSQPWRIQEEGVG